MQDLSLITEKVRKTLNVEQANHLVGKRITVKYIDFYGDVCVRSFILGGVMSEYAFYKNKPSIDKKFNTKLDCLAHNMNFDEFMKLIETYIMVDNNGNNTLFRCKDHDGIFWYGCEGRYIEVLKIQRASRYPANRKPRAIMKYRKNNK